MDRADPPGSPVLVDFERFLVEHVEGILQLDVAVDVARKRFGLRIEDRVVAQLHDLRILRRHVDERVSGDARLAIREPLEQVGVAKRAHAHRRALVVDLAVKRRDLELADVLGNRAHLAVSEQNGGIAVDDGNLRVVHFLDVRCEIVVDRVKNGRVLRGVAREDGKRGERSHDAYRGNGQRDERKRAKRLRLALVALLFRRALLIAFALRVEEQKRRKQDENGNEKPRVSAVDVDRRMKPPVRGEYHDNEHDRRDDDRALAPRFHVLHEMRRLDMGSSTARARTVPACGRPSLRALGLAPAAERRAHAIGVHPRLFQCLEQCVDSR